MAMDLKWLLSADDKASPVFDKLKHNATQATDGVSKALSTVGGSLSGMMGVWAGLTAVVAGGAAFKAIISETIAWTGESVKLSKSLGITTQEASVLNVALGDVYLSYEDMLAANSRLTRTMIKSEEAFTSLGVATRDQNGNYRSSVSIMADVNGKLLQIKEGTDRNIAGTSIYGKGWQEVSGILKLTPAVLKEAQEKAEKLHLIVGPDGVDKMKKYKAMMNDVEDVHKSFTVQIGNELLPMLTELGVALGDVGIVAAHESAEIFKGMKSMAILVRQTFGNAGEAGAGFFSNMSDGMGLDEAIAEFSAQRGALNDLTLRQIDKTMDPDKYATKKESAEERYRREKEEAEKRLELMDKELSAFKALEDSKTAVAKGQSDIRLSALKSSYDQGEATTQEYFRAEHKSLMESAQIRVNSAVAYLNKESEVLSTIGTLQGESSKEYLSQLAKHNKAIEDVQTSQLAFGKAYIDSEAKLTLALKARTDEYTKINISAMEAAGQYVEAERLKQELDQRSVEFLRLKKEALAGMEGAVQALADKEQSAALANIAALQREDEARRKYADDIRALQSKINESNGVSGDVLSAQDAIQAALNQKKTIEYQLQTAITSGVLADYSYAVQMNGLMAVRLTQLDQELALVLRKANLNALNNSDQIIVNDLIAKGLSQEAFWLQKKIDLRNLENKIQQDNLTFEKQIEQAIKSENTELQESLRLSQAITNEQNRSAGDAINDRAFTSSVASVSSSSTVASQSQFSGFINPNAFPSNLSAPFMGGMATGTNYVPADGYAYLHKGEAVVPAKYNSGGQSSTSIDVSGGITIQIQGGSTSTETAKEIARKILPELQQLQTRYRKAA